MIQYLTSVRLRMLAILIVFPAAVLRSELDRPKLRKQLIRHEDKKFAVYKDSEEIPTIGVGFNLKKGGAKARIEELGLNYDKVLSGEQKLSDSQIDKLLDADIDSAIADCKATFPKFADLSDVRQRVLIDMMFNLGKAKLGGFKKMIAAIDEGKFDKAANEMKASKWYKQVKDRGPRLEGMMRDDKDPE